MFEGMVAGARRVGIPAPAGLAATGQRLRERRAPHDPLRIEAQWDGQRVTAPAILDFDSRTPDTRQLAGCTVGEALARLPGLCAAAPRAQTVVAMAAFVAAGAEGAARGEARDEERIVAAETAQEHLSRLMLDWPVLFGHEPRRERFAVLHHGLAQIGGGRAAYELGGDLLDLVAVELLGGFFRATREPAALREFVERARQGGTIGEALADLIEIGTSTSEHEAVPLLPSLSAQAWGETLGGLPSPQFCRTPSLHGQAHETGVLARHAGSMLVRILLTKGHRIAARLFARVIDLADCASRLRHPLADDMPALLDAAPLGDRAGLAWVETAGGLVLHAVRLDDGRIAEYSIVGPTQWNFHPEGPFMIEGSGWSAASIEAARLRFAALVLSLDPGEGFEIVLKPAEA